MAHRSQPVRIVLVDNHPLFRTGMRFVLDNTQTMSVVAEAGDSRSARDVIGRHRPDVVVLDMVLGDGRGLELLQEVSTLAPDAAVLMVSMFDESIYAERCIRSGASGYLMKSAAPDSLTAAVAAVARGEVFLSPALTQRLMQRMSSGVSPQERPIQTLTDRELEVFELVALGKSTREMGRCLGISPKTVESHQSRIKRKLGVGSTHELLRVAMGWHQEQGRLRVPQAKAG